MCTVIVHVPTDAEAPIRLLAVRDEDPARTWDPLGQWWPELPGVSGVRDRQAGGAWLAADAAAGRVAVILNRADIVADSDEPLVSRGRVVLDAVEGRMPEGRPHTHGFNLVEVTASQASVTMWDGAPVRRVVLAPGVHIIAHDDVDDPATARIVAWRGAFAEVAAREGADGADWAEPWLDALERTSAVGPVDDRAIVRDNRPFGYPTLSLLVCAVSVGVAGVDVRYGEFDRPGVWNRPALV